MPWPACGKSVPSAHRGSPNSLLNPMKVTLPCVVFMAVGVLVGVLAQRMSAEVAANKEFSRAKGEWGDSQMAVDSLAQSLVAWGNKHERLPDDLGPLKLPPKCKGVLYLLNTGSHGQEALAAWPIRHPPGRRGDSGPFFIFVEIRRPVGKHLPPALMTHGMQQATWADFRKVLAGKKWLVEVVP